MILACIIVTKHQFIPLLSAFTSVPTFLLSYKKINVISIGQKLICHTEFQFFWFSWFLEFRHKFRNTIHYTYMFSCFSCSANLENLDLYFSDTKYDFRLVTSHSERLTVLLKPKAASVV
jgi:hypothetical protein